MKRWMIGILCIVLLLPATIQAAHGDEDETQAECERRTIAAAYRLKFAMYDGDIFNWEDYVRVASKMFNNSLEKYPESMELNERLQDLTFDRVKDEDISERERKSLQDSLDNHYKNLYEENPKSILHIYLYSRTIYDGKENLRLADQMLKIDKNSYWANEAAGWSYDRLRQCDKAEKYLKRAIAIDSTKFDAYSALARSYLENKRYEEAFPLALKAYRLALHPRLGSNDYGNAKVSAMELRDKELDIQIERAALQKITPEEEDALWYFRYRAEEISKAYRIIEEPDSVYRYIALMETCCELLDQPWSKARLLCDKACFEAWQGNNEEALELLEQAAEQGFRDYTYIETNSDLAGLQEEGRLKELIIPMKETAKKHALSNPINETAPDFTLVSTDGDTVTLSDLKGRIVILDFWSMCCGSVGAYTMMIVEKYLEGHPDEFYFFGVGNGITDLEAFKELFREEWKIEAPVLIANQEVFDEYGIEGTPYILLIDKQGNKTYCNIGYGKNKVGYTKKIHDMLDWWLEELKKE
ncbi:redoxin domain-containing protein [candidate division WOR-3 bacterium]|nr:redoxin domain-containing protein [candidate division WOR-3 bacterium]